MCGDTGDMLRFRNQPDSSSKKTNKKRWKLRKEYPLSEFFRFEAHDELNGVNRKQADVVDQKKIGEQLDEKDLVHTTKKVDVFDNLTYEDAIINMLVRIRFLQDRMWIRNITKARKKKKFVCGFNEVTKHLLENDLKLVILANDIKKVEGLADKLRRFCVVNKVPIFNSCKKRVIGKTLGRFPFVSVVGIINVDGAQDLYDKVLLLLNNQEIELALSRHIDQLSLLA
uniref:Ribosomal_L7Ae domain-containing protein n=1 Tax=Syphacia muris TaxID=451379 RepID=A0A0N5AP59_9BILA